MIEAPEKPELHHHKTGLPWFDLIVPIAVLCISIASLLTSLQSEKSMHALVEQNTRLVSAQSTPLLMLDTSNLSDNKPVISMTLSNVGTGPAQIAWFHVVDAQGQDYTGGSLYERVQSSTHTPPSHRSRSRRRSCAAATCATSSSFLAPTPPPRSQRGRA